jgi:hypothetical protein
MASDHVIFLEQGWFLIMRRRVARILFDQTDAAKRLGLIRLTLGYTILRTVWHLPPGEFFEEHQSMMLSSSLGKKSFRRLTKEEFELLRWIVLVSVGLWSLGCRFRLLKLIANTSFASLSAFVVNFHPQLWNYNSHLNIFLAISSLVDTNEAYSLCDQARETDGKKYSTQAQSLALATMQLYFVLTYFQAGLSKLLYGGLCWVTTGQTLKAALGETGTPLGKYLSKFKLFTIGASALTLCYELALLPALIFGWTRRRWIGFCTLLFHLGVKWTMDISFWHLAAFSFPLFILPADLDEQIKKLI